MMDDFNYMEIIRIEAIAFLIVVAIFVIKSWF